MHFTGEKRILLSWHLLRYRTGCKDRTSTLCKSLFSRLCTCAATNGRLAMTCRSVLPAQRSLEPLPSYSSISLHLTALRCLDARRSYDYYGYDTRQIAILFIVGFMSSMTFGSIAGALADKYGRRMACTYPLTPLLRLGRASCEPRWRANQS